MIKYMFDTPNIIRNCHECPLCKLVEITGKNPLDLEAATHCNLLDGKRVVPRTNGNGIPVNCPLKDVED